MGEGAGINKRELMQCVAETAEEKSERLRKRRGIVPDAVLRWPVCCSSILLCSHMEDIRY